MIDPSLAVAAAIISRLKAYAQVTDIVGQRVYDVVIPAAQLPYVTVDQPQVLPMRMGSGCEAGAEISILVHGWSNGPESVEVKQLGAALIAALDEHELVLTGHSTVLNELEQVIYLNDPDGIVKHAAVTFRILTEPT